MTTELKKFNPNDLIRIAVDQNADLDKLEKLMDLQLRWEANEAKKAFTAAMAAFKAECPMLPRDGEVDFVNKKGQRVHYKHSTLGGISEVVTPILSKHGLSVTFDSMQSKDGITVTCEVTHTGGHVIRRSLTAPPDNSGSKNPMQAICSTATYLSRYTEVLALGLATEYVNDDDGQSWGVPFQEKPSTTSPSEPPQEQQSGKQSHDQRVQHAVAKFGAKFAVTQTDIEHFLNSKRTGSPIPASQWQDEDFKRLTVLHRDLCKIPAGPDRVKAVREKFCLQNHIERVQRVVAEFKAEFGVILEDIEAFLGGKNEPPLLEIQWGDREFEKLTKLKRELCEIPAGPDRIRFVREIFGLPSSAVEG